jgi:hypothetical protein
MPQIEAPRLSVYRYHNLKQYNSNFWQSLTTTQSVGANANHVFSVSGKCGVVLIFSATKHASAISYRYSSLTFCCSLLRSSSKLLSTSGHMPLARITVRSWEFRFSRRRVWSLESSGMCSHVEVDRRFRGRTHLWNVGQLQRDYTELHPRRLNTSTFRSFIEDSTLNKKPAMTMQIIEEKQDFKDVTSL